MRIVIQRVSQASVLVSKDVVGEISHGLLLLVGFVQDDDESDLDWAAQKVVNMRIFSDEKSKMNYSLLDSGGSVLIVSQFTLLASTRKGNRPSFIRSASPVQAESLYELFVEKMRAYTTVHTGIFGAMMEVKLINDGPVTILVDTKNRE